MAHSKVFNENNLLNGRGKFQGINKEWWGSQNCEIFLPEPKRRREKGAGDVEGAVVRAACGPCQNHSTAGWPRQNALMPSWSTF